MKAKEFLNQYNPIRHLLLGFAIKLTRNRNDANDLLQETLCKAYANRHTFKPGTHFKSWMTTIMRNQYISQYRKMRTRNKVEEPVESLMYAVEIKASDMDPFSRIMTRELKKMIRSLKRDFRIPFEMFFKGYQYDEIAEKMKIPIGTVKSRLYFARKKLQKMVRLQYGSTNFRKAS